MPGASGDRPELAAAVAGEWGAVRPRLHRALDFVPDVHSVAHEWSGEIADLLTAYGRGAASPVDAINDALDRIDALDGDLGAVLTVAPDARAAATDATARWKAGTARALEGIPVLVKDIIDTAGLRTTGGSRWLADRVPATSAAVVETLEAAGAIVIAKTATFELACGDEDQPLGITRNPWDRLRTTGGSSSGTAAGVAAAYAPLGLGSDTGGSIRIPSSYCGLVGLRPTPGSVPTDGVIALAHTFDTVGPMARTVGDVARAFDVLAPHRQRVSIDRPLRVARLGGWMEAVLDPATRAGLDATCAAIASLDGVAEPAVDTIEWDDVWRCGEVAYAITMVECATVHTRTPLDLLSPAFAARVLVGRAISDDEAAIAHRARLTLREQAIALFTDVDVLICAGTVSPAPLFDALDSPVEGVERNWLDVTARTMGPWSLTGMPVLALPAGRSPDGLPVGVQLVGSPGAEDRLLALGAALQHARPGHRFPACTGVSSDDRLGVSP